MNINNIQYIIIYNKCIETKNSICNLKYREIKNKKNLSFNIELNIIKEKDYRKIVRNFKRLKDKMAKKDNYLQKMFIYVSGYNDNIYKHVEFINAINAIMKPTKKDMYNYIYDNICDYLDVFFVDKNICNFKDNKCGEKINTTSDVGCCRHYEHKRLGPLLLTNNLVTCKYLKDKRCSAKCISCKLYTCDYMKKNGIVFKLKDMFLIDAFFNPIQKYFIKYKVFTPKEEIMKLLLIFG